MKYIITRASIKDPEVKPIDGAIEGQVHYFDFRFSSIEDDKDSWKQFNEACRDIVKLQNGNYMGIEKNPTNVWVLEIDDLNKFVEENGEIILKAAYNEEGYMSVVIYDDWRE